MNHENSNLPIQKTKKQLSSNGRFQELNQEDQTRLSGIGPVFSEVPRNLLGESWSTTEDPQELSLRAKNQGPAVYTAPPGGLSQTRFQASFGKNCWGCSADAGEDTE